MDAILLCMKKRGIRFFKRIKFQNTDVIRFHAKNNFLGLLNTREREFDNILLIAHGSSKAILTTTHDYNTPYTVYISADEVNAFQNDFVFAVSCSTANDFGKRCVDEGAIAYLGYQVELGCLFYSYTGKNSNVPKRITTAVDTIIKRVFVEALSFAYEEFLTNPYSVRVLRERFAYLLEKRIAQLTNMSAKQLYEEYNIKITECDCDKFVVDIILRVLSYLDDILPRLVCVGDENYISASYITYRKRNGADNESLLKELESIEAFKALSHNRYKQYLRDMAAK